MSTTNQVDTVTTPETTPQKPFEYNNGYLREMGVLGYLTLQTLVYPLERIKVLQQVEIMPEVLDENGVYKHRENFQAYYDRHAETQTFEAFYRGLGAKITKLIAKELSIYTVSDKIRDKVQVFDAREDPFKHATYNFISAALSGAFVETFVYPFELAKTRMICDSAAYDDRIYQNVYQALMKDGENKYPNIYRGAVFSLLGAAIYRGTQIGLYETLCNLGMNNYSDWVHLPASILITIFAQRITYPLDSIRRQVMLKNTPFEITSAETDTIIKRMSHPARSKDLMRGWNMQFYKSITSGLFLFGYKAIKGTISGAPDLISKFSH